MTVPRPLREHHEADRHYEGRLHTLHRSVGPIAHRRPETQTPLASPPMPSFSVVIPAHNEATVIRRALAFTADLRCGEAEVVVVANGCSDATADLARTVPSVRVLEVPHGSKPAALDAGDAVNNTFPRVYLDADVVLDATSLRRLADAVRVESAVVGAPRVRFRTEARPWGVRAFYDVYRRLPYATDGLVGLGVYALSAAGRRRFGSFPQVTADDLFVQRLFGPEERIILDDAWFDVETPHTLHDLLAVRTRVAYGNRELAGTDSTTYAPSTQATGRALLELVRAEAGLAPPALVYAGITFTARWRARGRDGARWHRDTSTR